MLHATQTERPSAEGSAQVGEQVMEAPIEWPSRPLGAEVQRAGHAVLATRRQHEMTGDLQPVGVDSTSASFIMHAE